MRKGRDKFLTMEKVFVCRYCKGVYPLAFCIDGDTCPRCDHDLWEARQMKADFQSDREEIQNEMEVTL